MLKILWKNFSGFLKGSKIRENGKNWNGGGKEGVGQTPEWAMGMDKFSWNFIFKTLYHLLRQGIRRVG